MCAQAVDLQDCVLAHASVLACVQSHVTTVT
jgi:hypothetical protein